MEFIRDLFRHCNPGGAAIARTRFYEPASWTVPAGDDFLTGFVLVPDGQATLRSTALPAPVTLAAGDLFVMVRGLDYEISTPGAGHRRHATVQIPPEETREHAVPLATLVIGGFRFTDAPLEGGLVELPRFFLVRARSIEHDPPLAGVLRLICAELARQNPVPDPDLARLLLELFFSYALGHWRDHQATDPRGTRDASIFRALRLLHQDVGHAWSVLALAQASGLSRKVFLRRFREATGATPFDYLTRLRMDRAKELLSGTAKPLRQIAADIGYADAFAFSKAFKRIEQHSPQEYRRGRT